MKGILRGASISLLSMIIGALGACSDDAASSGGPASASSGNPGFGGGGGGSGSGGAEGGEGSGGGTDSGVHLGADAGGGGGGDGGGGGGDSGSTPPGSDSGTNPPGTCGGGGGANGGPGDLFPCDSTWKKDVSALPVAAESSGIIGGIGTWGAGGRFMIDFSIVFMHDDGTAPKHTFTIDYADESQSDPVPVPSGGSLEGETGYNCVSGGDCHLIVVQDSTKKLFELYSASNNGGSSWTAAQESVWDLTKHYTAAGRGLGCTSADAAGLSVMAGLIGVRETKAGKIDHALRFILPNSKIRKGPSFIAPATHGTSATSSTSGPPYGTRLRLKSAFDESRATTPGAKAILVALKKYGMILADGGEYALTAEDDRLEVAKDSSMSWANLLGSADVHFVTPQDFEVVDFSSIQHVTNCTLLP